MQYLLQGKTLKENIILNEKTDNNTYTFNLSLKNLVPEVKDNTVKFFDKETKKEVFNIVPPLMYDAAGETSTDIKIDIKENIRVILLKHLFVQMIQAVKQITCLCGWEM